MGSLVSILIAGECLDHQFEDPKLNQLDLVPLRDVASWRSYVNVAAMTGRSLGGPVGGFLADTIGWRWYSSIVRVQLTSLTLTSLSKVFYRAVPGHTVCVRHDIAEAPIFRISR